jgi:hypothetical protein
MVSQVQRLPWSGGVEVGSGEAEGLLGEPEGVFGVEVARECSPEPVCLGFGELGAGGAEPEWFRVAVAGQVLDGESDDAPR